MLSITRKFNVGALVYLLLLLRLLKIFIIEPINTQLFAEISLHLKEDLTSLEIYCDWNSDDIRTVKLCQQILWCHYSGVICMVSVLAPNSF